MFSAFRNTTLAAVVAGLGLSVAGGTKAMPITYGFTVTATSGPLAGTAAHGTFSYDSSSVVSGGGVNNAVGLLTSLSFSWNGVAYTQATANTGNLSFDASGTLTEALFGTNCIAGNCSVNPGVNEFAMFVVPGSLSAFVYGVSSEKVHTFDGLTTAAIAVPASEPASLTVLAMGIAGLGILRRTRRA